MPLSPSPAARSRLHTRQVSYDCFRRDDGGFDIEAHLTDVKDHDYALLTGVRAAGEPVHDIWMRVTIGRDFVISAIEGSFDRMPYPDACDAIVPAYQRLVGASLVRGFRQVLHEAMGVTRGCSHITELLAFLPTAAIQMFAGLQSELDTEQGEKPFQLDRCHALRSSGETVRRYYPRWHRNA